MAGGGVPAIVAFAAGFGETGVVAGLGEPGAGGVTAAAFAGEMAGEAPGVGLLAGDGEGRAGLDGVALPAGSAFSLAGETTGEAPGAELLTGDAGAPEPEAVGLAAGAASSFSTGALFPMFAKSGPNLILPSIMGRSKR